MRIDYSLLSKIMSYVSRTGNCDLANLQRQFRLAAATAYRAVRMAALLKLMRITKKDVQNGQILRRQLTFEQSHWFASWVRHLCEPSLASLRLKADSYMITQNEHLLLQRYLIQQHFSPFIIFYFLCTSFSRLDATRNQWASGCYFLHKA